MPNLIDLDEDSLYLVTWQNSSEVDYVQSVSLDTIKDFYRTIDDAYCAELWILSSEDNVPVIISSRKQIPSTEWTGPDLD